MENITVTQESPARRAAVAGLAVVGFFALVFIGMVLAIFAARFVPESANGFSSAAAYLSSVFTPAGTSATLTTVPNTVPFPVATSTAAVATTSPATTTAAVPVTTTHVAPSAGQQTTTAQVLPGSNGAVVYSGPLTGLPNLVATVTGVGYLDSNGNFIPATTILNSQPLAVKFTITNAGTNVTGGWNFQALLPTRANSQYAYNSTQQNSLNPGDHVDFTLHLDAGQAQIGSNETITVTADPNHQITESSENNTSTATISVSNQN